MWMSIRCRISCCHNVDNIVSTALLGIPPETHSADGGVMNLSVGKPLGTWGTLMLHWDLSHPCWQC